MTLKSKNLSCQITRRSSFHTRHLVEIATHLSPRWGFRGFGLLVCYTHAAPLGLQHKDEKTAKQGSPNKNQCAYNFFVHNNHLSSDSRYLNNSKVWKRIR